LCEVNNEKGTRVSAVGKCEPSTLQGHLNMTVAKEITREGLVLANMGIIRWDIGGINDQKMITY
jgi:hypothetical protein